MEYLIAPAIIIGIAILLFVGQKYITRPLYIWMETRKLEREAEMEIYDQMNWARAQQAAADKILRRNGEKP